MDEKTVREAVARWLRTMPPHAKLDGDFCISKLTAAVMKLRPKVTVKTIENWMMAGSDVFRLHHAVARARDDLTAAGVEVTDAE